MMKMKGERKVNKKDSNAFKNREKTRHLNEKFKTTLLIIYPPKKKSCQEGISCKQFSFS